MAVDNDDDLLAMLTEDDFGEKWLTESGVEFLGIPNFPNVDETNVRGFNPTLQILASFAERVPRNCTIWRDKDQSRWTVWNQDAVGDGSFVVLDLRAVT